MIKNNNALFSTSSDSVISEKLAKDPTTKERASELFNKAKSKKERSLAMDSLHFLKERLGDEAYTMYRMLHRVIG